MENALDTASAKGVHPFTVDQWVSHAVQEAAPDEGLRFDLRLHRRLLCYRPYSLRDRSGGQKPDADEEDRRSMSAGNMAESPPPDMSCRWRRASSDMGSESDDEEPRTRRLALRCCHSLATVALDASELVAFEYRGAVPPTSTFLTMHGGGIPNFAYCKVDICGAEVSSEEEVTRLGELLLLFQNAKRLHLESARLGSGMGKNALPVPFPTLSDLRHLELRGRLPDDDDTAVVGAADPWYYTYNEAELLDAHRLKYNGHSVLAPASSMIACLRCSVREINLVHYQGGRAQRALAKFLLCNALAIDKLWCEFAEGLLWTQTQLMREIKGWVMNKSASTHFL
ncbi:hypothetical protein C2845_PM06G24280 [Panicum miliaceum]|uniref:FBD domain-containing protein n=1 Tax=Panicum miliaceum TaxID=4540 RepID=A0A3L6RER0_PANMI|nr:hypothetical protein C2845_PM06G24280 [Panicum miliaceum]